MAFALASTATPARRIANVRVAHKARKSTLVRFRQETSPELRNATLICEDSVKELEGLLDNGESMAALRRFNAALGNLTADNWRAKLLPVMNELCYNLESFNPAFTHVMLKVQSSIAHSDYVRRDNALKNLVIPLAGEYGMHNGEAQAKTHRELFADWFFSMFQFPVTDLIRDSESPVLAPALFDQMMRDIGTAGTLGGCPQTQAVYAMGYNLAIEYMADYEKRWMLESFRDMDAKFMAAQGCSVDWIFLEVHAADEMEHAAIGHDAVTSFVPEQQKDVLRRAMLDHDRDFAAFYNGIAAMLE